MASYPHQPRVLDLKKVLQQLGFLSFEDNQMSSSQFQVPIVHELKPTDISL